MLAACDQPLGESRQRINVVRIVLGEEPGRGRGGWYRTMPSGARLLDGAVAQIAA